MDTTEFLRLLLPQTGLIVLAVPRQFTNDKGKLVGYFDHSVCASIEEAVQVAVNLNWNHDDVFFALSTFREKSVWNPSKPNRATGGMGKHETRTQANALSVKSFFLDLDINPTPTTEQANKVFPSKPEALSALRAFCKKVGMSKPMVVDSGGGLHCYWPLKEEVPAAEWKLVAQKFKDICLHEELHIDPSVPADSARVLRVLGTCNMKKAHARPVTLLSKAIGCFDIAMYDQMFSTYIENNGVTHLTTKPKASGASAAPASILGDNMGVTNDPINPDRVAFHCAQFAHQIATRGAGASEPMWFNMLSIGNLSEPRRETLLALSDGHPGFDEQVMMDRASRWTGPASCKKFHELNPALCDACPQWQQITSPAQLGRTLISDAPPVVELNLPDVVGPAVVEIPNPPAPYVRKNGRVLIVSEDKDGREVIHEVCPFDMYPVRVMRQTTLGGEVKETTRWCLVLPRLGPTFHDIPPKILADQRSLHTFLSEKGGYIRKSQLGDIQDYMSAYLNELNKLIDREKAYERLGWHEGTAEFVVGESVIHRDGTITAHKMAADALNSTKHCIHASGTLADWRKLIEFYNAPGYECTRAMFYGSFASTLMILTGHAGSLITAYGRSGLGKSTALELVASVWGKPNDYLINGGRNGVTQNVLFHNLSVYHNLPYCIDETTDRTPEEMRELSLNISQGRSKERMKGSDHDGNIRTWCNLTMTTTNSDDVSQITSVGRDSSAHLARVIPLPFSIPSASTEAKIAADEFKRGLRQNYGHAGIVFMQYVMEHIDEVKQFVHDMMAKVDRDVNAAPHERFWTSAVAICMVAASITHKLGLHTFDYKADYKWMLQHITVMRCVVSDAVSSPMDIINEFLNSALPNTLVMSAKASSNLDNVAVRPGGFGGLKVHHDLDEGGIYIARSAMVEYCAEHKVSFRDVEGELVRRGVIISKNVQKVLGADTVYAKGQTRCWKVMANRLEGDFIEAVNAAIVHEDTLGP